MGTVRPHQIVEDRNSGFDAIKLTEYPYEGIIISYGQVNFIPDEENDTLRIKFDYDILEGNVPDWNKPKFEQYIGELLQELIHQGIQENSLTYTGGIDDENRTGDPIEPDKQ